MGPEPDFAPDIGIEQGQVPFRSATLSPHPWKRFVALGDSFTEGLDDPEPLRPGRYRGWADLVAHELSFGVPNFTYANLAVRAQRLRQVIDTQLGPALRLDPDLVSIQAGGNDLLHPGADPDKLAGVIEDAVVALSIHSPTVVIFAGPDSGRSTVLGQFRIKIAVFNENVRSVAPHHGALVADLWAMTELQDPRMWSPDRLHPSSMGHLAVASMVLETLHVPHSMVPQQLSPLPPRGRRETWSDNRLWAREYLVPYVVKGIRRQSRNYQFGAKRPIPAPLEASRRAWGFPDR